MKHKGVSARLFKKNFAQPFGCGLLSGQLGRWQRLSGGGNKSYSGHLLSLPLPVAILTLDYGDDHASDAN